MDVLVGENANQGCRRRSEDGTKQIYTLVVTRDNALNSCDNARNRYGKRFWQRSRIGSECKDIT